MGSPRNKRVPTERSLTGRPTSPRLASFDYRGAFRCFVTIGTYDKRPYFVGDWPYAETVVLLSRAAGRYGGDVLAYCFMPDHVHMLFEIREEGDLAKTIRIFKQTTSYRFRRYRNAPLWQRSYYDRILRRDEATAAVVRYILNNPVRRGLAEDPRNYPLLGSFVAPVDDWL